MEAKQVVGAVKQLELPNIAVKPTRLRRVAYFRR